MRKHLLFQQLDDMQPLLKYGCFHTDSVTNACIYKLAYHCRSEVFLMMRCLRDMNMSKFVAEDVPLFLSLIDDLFPALKADRASFPEISAALEKVSTSSMYATASNSQACPLGSLFVSQQIHQYC